MAGDAADGGCLGSGAGVGVGFRFDSHSPFSGVKDPALDKLLAEGPGTLDENKRKRSTSEAAKLISDKAYAPVHVSRSRRRTSRSRASPAPA